MTFQQYLDQLLSPATLATYLRYHQRFLHWLESQHLSPQQTSYTDLLAYIQALRQRSLSPKSINAHLCLIRHFYRFLMAQNLATHNPAETLQLRGISRSIPHKLLTQNQLQEILHAYQPQSPLQHRNHLLLSLIIHQALRRAELQALQPTHIAHNQLWVPPTAHTPERFLPLLPQQQPMLSHYLTHSRPQLLAQRPAPTLALLPTLQGAASLKNVLYGLFAQLKAQLPYLCSPAQVRQSRIRIWLNTLGLRRAQYLAGHASPHTTQRYASLPLKDLQKQLRRFHPMD